MGVQGLGCSVGFGIRVQGFRVWGLGLRGLGGVGIWGFAQFAQNFHIFSALDHLQPPEVLLSGFRSLGFRV